MDWSKLTDWIKLRPPHLLPIFGAMTLLLFAPARFLSVLGLDTLLGQFRGWIGGIWLIAGSLLVSHFAMDTFAPQHRRFKEWVRTRQLVKRIPKLLRGA